MAEENYTVDTGVPIPESKGVPLRTLKVGESVVFPLSRRNSIQSMVAVLKKTTGREYTVKKINGEEARVWRVK